MSTNGSANGNGDAVATLSDDLIARAQAIASRSDELLHLLEDAQQRLLDSGDGDKAQAQRRIRSASTAKASSTPKASSSGRARKASRKDGISDGLRLLTTQMAVAGANRKQIAARLRDEFGVQDPEPILKDMGL